MLVTIERPFAGGLVLTAYDRGVRDGEGFGGFVVGGGLGGAGRGGAGLGGAGFGGGGGAGVVAGGGGAGRAGAFLGGGGGAGFGGGFGAGGLGVGDVQGQCQWSGRPGTPVGAVTGGFVPA